MKVESLISFIETKVFMTANTELLGIIKTNILAKGYTIAEFLSYKLQPDLMYRLGTGDLLLIAKAIYEANNTLIQLNNYFTNYELIAYKNYERAKENKSDFVLQSCAKIGKNQWFAVATIEQIALMSRAKIIVPLVHDILGELPIDNNRVDEISKLLMKNDYYNNQIRINIDNSTGVFPNIDIVNNTITISRECSCTIIDGKHRIAAIEQAYFSFAKPQKHFTENFFSIAISFVSEQEMSKIIAQEIQTKKWDTAYTKALEDSYANSIASYIIKNANPVYKNNTVATKQECVLNKGFIVYAELVECIECEYNTNNIVYDKEADNIKEWLTSFFNALYILLANDFDHRYTSRQIRWATKHQAIYGYIYLSKYLYGDADWENKLVKVINGIDFSNANYPIIIGGWSKSRENIKDIFEKAVAICITKN